jgi:tetratricopeptide (TPR) repeat protein
MTSVKRVWKWKRFILLCSAFLVPHSLRVCSHGSEGLAAPFSNGPTPSSGEPSLSEGLCRLKCQTELPRAVQRGMGPGTDRHARLVFALHSPQTYAIACDPGHLLLRGSRLRLRGGSALNAPDQNALGGSSGRAPMQVHGALQPGEPGPHSANGGGGGDAGGSLECAGPTLHLGENSTANEEAFVLMLNERDEGLRGKILQQIDLALRTNGLEDSKILADWKGFGARLLAMAGRNGAASASPELKALHSTCTTLYAMSDPNGPGGLMEMALQGWKLLEQSLSENEVEAWGAVQHSLGLAYQDRVLGSDLDNNRQAICHFNKSLAVYDRSRFPSQYAKTHHKLAVSILALQRALDTGVGASIGHLDDQRRLGLLQHAVSGFSSPLASGGNQVTSPEVTTPTHSVATPTPSVTGDADQRSEGKAALQAAIGHLELALQVYAVQQNADSLWRLQLDLASACLLWSRAENSSNVDRAVMYLEATLRSPGFSRDLQPHQWSAVHEALAVAIQQRQPTSEAQRLNNLDKAIEHYLAVLEVQRMLGAADAWAATQRAIADAWMAMVPVPARTLIGGNNALFHYGEALRLLTRGKNPLEFARLQRLMARACLAVASSLPPPLPGAEDRRELMHSQMLQHYNWSLEVLTKDNNPQEWASLHIEIAGRLMAMTSVSKQRGGGGGNLQVAVDHYQQALEVLNSSHSPQQFADAKSGLGAALGARAVGGGGWGGGGVSSCRGEDLELALQCFREAIEMVDKEVRPQEWARIQFQTAECLVSRVQGNRDKNLQEAAQACSAALSVFTAESSPEMWARAQGTMGWICSSKTTGDRAQNMLRSITHHWQALRVLTQAHSPTLWAATHMHLAEAFILQDTQDRGVSIEQAIQHCRQALQVYEGQGPDLARGKCFDLLARAYGQRQEESYVANLEMCLVYWKLALKAFSRRQHAAHKARIHGSLGMVYLKRRKGATFMNLERAIRHFEKALSVSKATITTRHTI